MDYYTKRGRRWTAYQAYLKNIMGTRKNLVVEKYATVSKVREIFIQPSLSCIISMEILFEKYKFD